MFKLRAREERGKTLTDWLDSSHSFSFAQYFDPFNMGFSDLRVINDDIVAPDGGFKLHPHANMEIIQENWNIRILWVCRKSFTRDMFR